MTASYSKEPWELKESDRSMRIFNRLKFYLSPGAFQIK